MIALNGIFYGLARGFSYDELSEEEKRGRKHKNKVVLEAERQAKVALDKVEKYAVLATIDKKELTIPFLNIKVPVQEAMNAVKKGTPKIGLEFLLGENGNYNDMRYFAEMKSLFSILRSLLFCYNHHYLCRKIATIYSERVPMRNCLCLFR